MLRRSFPLTLAMLMSLGVARGWAADPFEIVPSLTKPQPISLVGTDDGRKVGVGLVFRTGGPAAGYVCDGEKLSVWFSGSLAEDEDKVVLKSRGGHTLSADWSKDSVRGEAKIGKRQIKFTLELAVSGRMLRHDGKLDGERFVFGMIVTNQGEVYGAGGRPGRPPTRRVRRTARSKTVGTASDPTVPGGTTGKIPGGKPDPLLFKKLRCKFLLDRLAFRASRDDVGEITKDPVAIKIINQGILLGCPQFDGFRDSKQPK